MQEPREPDESESATVATDTVLEPPPARPLENRLSGERGS
jgi:hypothetical protein